MEGFELNIGRACNCRCCFCVSRQATPAELAWLPLEHARAEILRARSQGCDSLGFLGGEPTAYPHLRELIRHGRAIGFTRVALATNGLRLADPDLLGSLLEDGVTRVGVSMHSDLRSLEDRLTRVPGAFERKRQALRNLRAARDAGRLPDGLSVNPLLHRRILNRLPRLVGFFLGLGILDIRFNSFRPVDLGRTDRSLCPSFKEAMPRVVELILENERSHRAHLTFGDFPWCVWPWAFLDNPVLVKRYVGEYHDLPTRVAIFSDGRSAHDLGLARFSWAQARRDRLKAKPPACRACAWEPTCEGFWQTYLELHGEGEARPPAYPPPDAAARA